MDQLKLGYTLDSMNSSRNILFAFVSGTEVLYIGDISESFRRRLYGYQNADATQQTNLVVNRLLSQLLLAGVEIEIYALPDRGLLHLGSSDIDLASVLEDSLISGLKPIWNGCGLEG